MGMMYQQGDVTFEKVESVSGKIQKQKGKIIVAQGSSTGHAHAINDKNVSLSKDGEIMFLSSGEEFTVTHEEHKPVTLPAGSYRVGIIREYDHITEMERQVQD
jgi:hypothetical protein